MCRTMLHLSMIGWLGRTDITQKTLDAEFPLDSDETIAAISQSRISHRVKHPSRLENRAYDWFAGSRAAACRGVTTVVDFATQFRGQGLREAVAARG